MAQLDLQRKDPEDQLDLCFLEDLLHPLDQLNLLVPGLCFEDQSHLSDQLLPQDLRC